jgi:ribosome-associated toxin RatA of RatAB toxin-antitoxin module
MRNFFSSVNISASPAKVWQVLADVERWPEWTASVHRMERLDPSPLDIGSRVRIEQPKLPSAIWIVTDWQPEKMFSWVLRRPGTVAIGDHIIEPTAEGCRVTFNVRFEGPFAAVAGLFAGNLTDRYLAMESAGLKLRSEMVR